MVHHVWPEGLVRLEAVLGGDLERARQLASWCEACAGLPGRTARILYALLFELTGLHEMGIRFADRAELSAPDTIVRSTYIEHFEAIRVAMVGTKLFGVRLAMLVTALPLLSLLYAVALADGLVQRAIRRASGGQGVGEPVSPGEALAGGCLGLWRDGHAGVAGAGESQLGVDSDRSSRRRTGAGAVDVLQEAHLGDRPRRLIQDSSAVGFGRYDPSLEPSGRSSTALQSSSRTDSRAETVLARPSDCSVSSSSCADRGGFLSDWRDRARRHTRHPATGPRDASRTHPGAGPRCRRASGSPQENRVCCT